MAVAQGYGKTVTSGSVFAYDVGDTRNSFKGKPTTNLLTTIDKAGTNDSTYFKTNSGTEVKYVPNVGVRTVHYVNILNDYGGGSGNCCPAPMYFGDFTVSPSTQYTYQIIYKTTTGYSHPNYMYHYEYNGGTYITEYGLHDTGRIQDLGDGWKHAWGTFTSNASTNRFITYLFHYEYGVWNKIEVAGIMLTQGSNIIPPTQFLNVGVTRSSTQGLLPLVGNSTLDLSNVSFDANAQISLDGSSDYVKISQNSNFFTNQWTWEMVVKFTSNTGTYQGMIWAEGDTGGGSGLQYLLTLYNHTYFHYRIINASTGWTNTDTSTVNFTPSNNNHIVWQFNNGVTSIYVNGALFHTNSGRGAYNGGTNSPVFVGARNDGAYSSAMQPSVIKHYNRILSAGEVRQNYLHYKTRFNLS